MLHLTGNGASQLGVEPRARASFVHQRGWKSHWKTHPLSGDFRAPPACCAAPGKRLAGLCLGLLVSLEQGEVLSYLSGHREGA